MFIYYISTCKYNMTHDSIQVSNKPVLQVCFWISLKHQYKHTPSHANHLTGNTKSKFEKFGLLWVEANNAEVWLIVGRDRLIYWSGLCALSHFALCLRRRRNMPPLRTAPEFTTTANLPTWSVWRFSFYCFKIALAVLQIGVAVFDLFQPNSNGFILINVCSSVHLIATGFLDLIQLLRQLLDDNDEPRHADIRAGDCVPRCVDIRVDGDEPRHADIRAGDCAPRCVNIRVDDDESRHADIHAGDYAPRCVNICVYGGEPRHADIRAGECVPRCVDIRVDGGEPRHADICAGDYAPRCVNIRVDDDEPSHEDIRAGDYSPRCVNIHVDDDEPRHADIRTGDYAPRCVNIRVDNDEPRHADIRAGDYSPRYVQRVGAYVPRDDHWI